MKKLQVLIISLLFLISNNIQASFLQGPNPYSFGPQGRSVSDLRDFAKPKNMVRILPNMPVAATDSSGNRVYYSPNGKMTVSVAKDGSMSFSTGGISKNFNTSGEYTGSTKTLRGTGLLQEIKNKDDKVIGYRALNGDGKTAQTFDKNKNLTATYVYTGQGAKINYVQNEMTGGRTYYDEYERAMKDVDMDGYILRTYQYEDVSYIMADTDSTRKELTVIKDERTDSTTGLLVSTRDYGYDVEEIQTGTGKVRYNYAYSSTYYDRHGKIVCMKNPDGQITTEYHYKNDIHGNIITDYILDNTTNQKTYFDENGSRDYTINAQGTVVTRYFDDYAINYEEGAVTSVTRYDIDGTELYTTFKNVIYNDDGTIDEVREGEDLVIEKYYYKYVDGNKVIDYVENNMDQEFETKTYTWYSDDGRPMFVTSTKEKPEDIASDNVLMYYSWSADGTRLEGAFNKKTGVAKYEDMTKEQVYEALNERLIAKNIYDKGQLIGKWDAQKHELTISINQRAWISLKLPREPEADSIRAIMTYAKDISDEIEANRSKPKEEKGYPLLTSLLKKYGLIDSYPTEQEMEDLVTDHQKENNNN